ncbi:MAG: clan AA aspartic protease [Chloroflexota bacterium]|nr:clan AA aspartic protease [Chloroflexota bacterium]MDE2958563.1 clan AA aspartic protease [Chloroflexota bacterium]
MIRGEVRPARDDGTGLEARIPVDIVGITRIFRTLEVVVDTGYTGWMSLPEPIINDVGLDYAGIRPATLANGQTVATSAYSARLLWHGQPVDIVVQALNSKPMIGTTLLANCRLTIDWWDGGDVIIEERMPPAG